MARIKRNDCYGCPECKHCGRDQTYYVAVCDICGEMSLSAKVYSDGESELCDECMQRKHVRDMVEAYAEDIARDFAEEMIEMYGGRWLKDNCEEVEG